jgi:archaellum component FlaG (FlaF/FlaG flagellin family)
VLTIILAIVLLIAAITRTTLSQNAYAEPSTVVKVAPAENIYYTNTTRVGDTFTVSIIAQDIGEPGFYGWEIILSWTPGIINCTMETLNLKIWRYYMGPWVTDPIDNEAGTYHQSLTGKYPAEPVTGTFWLVNLTFQITRLPREGQTLQTSLTISPPVGMSYCLADKNAAEIPHDFIHGVYKLISPRPPLPEIILKITPQSILNPSLTPCTNFTINITVINAKYFHGFKLKLGYNKTILECTEVKEGNMLKSFGETAVSFLINNSEGHVLISINLTDPQAIAEGNGTLTALTFHVLNLGESVFHLYETELYDSEETPLSHTTSDGYFNNILMPKVFVDPPVFVDPSMVPGDEFEISIKAANISDLYDFEFRLTYDTNILNGLGIIVIPFDKATSFELQFTLNDTNGEIWVKVQYFPPAKPLSTLSPRTLLKLFFQVQSYGATWLHFSQSVLSDSLHMQIKHIAEDGYISVLRRDVAVINVTPEFTEAYKGWKIGINVTVKNLGDIPETFNVTLLINNNKIETKKVESLTPNTTALLAFTFDTLQSWVMPCHNYTIKVEASILPYEIDIENNVLEDGQIHIKLMGDINGDGAVNFNDAIIAGAAFGSKPGDSNWNPYADLNRDGCVNYLDLIILGSNFGYSCHE